MLSVHPCYPSLTRQDDFLDVIYWGRQLVALVVAVYCGLAGFIGINTLIVSVCPCMACYWVMYSSRGLLVNVAVVYVFVSVHRVDISQFGTPYEVLTEGFKETLSVFLVSC